MDTPMLVDQQKTTFINNVQTLGAIKRTYQVLCSLGRDDSLRNQYCWHTLMMMMMMIKIQ